MGNLMQLLNFDVNWILGTEVTNLSYTAITFSMLLRIAF